ncbi:MAG: tRNA (N6-isopentenyl adenosine(37)-C2)-methylthiotransferase MiaB [candidate division WOR-3 bacterium]
MEKSKNKFYIRTYGCQMNKYDSEIIRSLLQKENFEEVSKIEEADYIFFNTCAVRENAEKRVLGRLDSLIGLKKKKPEVIVSVLGCVAKHNKTLFTHPVVDFIAPPDSYRELINTIKAKNKKIIPENPDEQYSEILPSPFKTSAYISITRGCNHFCSYCIVPYLRNKLRSRPPEDILKEAEKLVSEGTKEITLLGQNVNAYYYKGVDFPQILKMVSKIKDLKLLSFLTSHPADLPKNLFEVMAESQKIAKYLHLPLQSGSDKILSKMRRRYKINDYINIINKARSLLPELSLTTDIIVGFPGELEEDYKKTLDAVKRIRFDYAYMFAYSKREGTLASLFPLEVKDSIKKERLRILIETQNKITLEKTRELLGKELQVLTIENGKKNGQKIGKTKNGRIVILPGVAKIGFEYIIKIDKINGWVPIGEIKKEVN